jgi:hypothetical protein
MAELHGFPGCCSAWTVSGVGYSAPEELKNLMARGYASLSLILAEYQMRTHRQTVEDAGFKLVASWIGSHGSPCHLFFAAQQLYTIPEVDK